MLKSFLKSGQYDKVLLFLNNPIVSLDVPYANACSCLEAQDLHNIIQSPCLSQEDLKTLLSPDCVYSAIRALSRAPNLLPLLPSNVLEYNGSVRSRNEVEIFKQSIQRGFAGESVTINWRSHLTSMVDNVDFFGLQQIFPVESVIEAQRNAFMAHLTPEIIKYTSDEDLRWMVAICKPDMRLVLAPNCRDKVKALETQFFRLLTTFFIRKRINSRLERLHAKKVDDKSRRLNERILKYESFLAEIDESVANFLLNHQQGAFAFNQNKQIVLLSYSIDNALKAIKQVSRPTFSFMKSTIYRCESSLSSADWMINLMEWYQLSFFKKAENLNTFLSIFMSKKPSNSALKEAFNLMASYSLDTDNIFNRLSLAQTKYMALHAYNSLSTQQTLTLDFQERKMIFLRRIRADRILFTPSTSCKVSIFTLDQIDLNAADRSHRLKYLKHLLKALVLYKSIASPLDLHFFMKCSSLEKRLSGTVFLDAFYQVFLSFEEFYFKIGHQIDPLGRPVIVLSPLASPFIAHALGKCFLASIVYRYRVPFVLDWEQFESALTKETPPPSSRISSLLEEFSFKNHELSVANELNVEFFKDSKEFDHNIYVKGMISLLKGDSRPKTLVAEEYRSSSVQLLYKFCVQEMGKGFISASSLSRRFSFREIYDLLFY